MLVYESVYELGSKGATFDQVRAGFTSRVAPYRSQLPEGDRELEDANLRVAIFDLIVSKVIIPKANKTYVALDFDIQGYSRGNEQVVVALLTDRIDAEMLMELVRHPGTHDRQSLARHVGRVVRARDELASALPQFDDMVESEVARLFLSPDVSVRSGKVYPKSFDNDGAAGPADPN
jgi:hypothetical protein